MKTRTKKFREIQLNIFSYVFYNKLSSLFHRSFRNHYDIVFTFLIYCLIILPYVLLLIYNLHFFCYRFYRYLSTLEQKKYFYCICILIKSYYQSSLSISRFLNFKYAKESKTPVKKMQSFFTTIILINSFL